ncbi:Protein of uncharacterised function (DUF551) [uncultured Ruminococcus sp.]|nr:Protein of uncharacterised function (DUF551) [uncultured Ruminococcus sp.]
MIHIKERLKQYADKYSDCYKYAGVYVKVIQDMIEQLLADLEQDEKENGWIPVSERLPEKCEDVLTSVKFTGCLGRYGTFKKIGHIDYYGKWSGDCIGGEVIAWIPLPEPYKEDER